MGYAWAPDSKEIAYVTNVDLVPAASTNNDVYTLRLDDPGAKPVKISMSLGSDDAPAYSPDGKWLAFRSQARAGYESDRFRLMLFDRRDDEESSSSCRSSIAGWMSLCGDRIRRRSILRAAMRDGRCACVTSLTASLKIRSERLRGRRVLRSSDQP